MHQLCFLTRSTNKTHYSVVGKSCDAANAAQATPLTMRLQYGRESAQD